MLFDMTTLLFLIVIIDIISFDVSHNGVLVYITSFGYIVFLIVIPLAKNTMFCSSDNNTLKKHNGREEKKKAINKQLKIIKKIRMKI